VKTHHRKQTITITTPTKAYVSTFSIVLCLIASSFGCGLCLEDGPISLPEPLLSYPRTYNVGGCACLMDNAWSFSVVGASIWSPALKEPSSSRGLVHVHAHFLAGNVLHDIIISLNLQYIHVSSRV